jgi:arylformamidase
MKLYDITPTVTADLGVWPGDTPATREVLLDIEKGHNITLSTLRATVHLGAHADAPSHYGLHAPTIEQRPLDVYIGPCAVVHVRGQRGERVGFEEVSRGIASIVPSSSVLPTRVLIVTGTFPDPRKWNDDFAALSPGLVDALHERGVRLIGIDTPSVDLFDSKDLPAHGRFLAHDMAILEGIVLEGVPAGIYELIALPLKLAGFDASPVRAILRTMD